MLVQSLVMEEVYLVRHGETEWNQTGRRQVSWIHRFLKAE
jgi:broad specificity phosphatase PhoE